MSYLSAGLPALLSLHKRPLWTFVIEVGSIPDIARRWWIWHLSKFESMAALFLPSARQACLQRSNNHRVREERSADGCQPKQHLVPLWVLLKTGLFNYIQASLSRWVSEKLQDMTPQQESAFHPKSRNTGLNSCCLITQHITGRNKTVPLSQPWQFRNIGDELLIMFIIKSVSCTPKSPAGLWGQSLCLLQNILAEDWASQRTSGHL